MPLQVEMDPRIISIFIKVSKKDCLLIDVGGVTFSRPRTSFLFVLGAREPRGLSPSFHLKKRDDFGPARRFCPPTLHHIDGDDGGQLKRSEMSNITYLNSSKQETAMF